jgi:hypothetical protein
MKTYRCNICGKDHPLNPSRDQHFSCDYRFGYGSKRDGDRLELDVCPKCEDKFTDNLVDLCSISPIIPVSTFEF